MDTWIHPFVPEPEVRTVPPKNHQAERAEPGQRDREASPLRMRVRSPVWADIAEQPDQRWIAGQTAVTVHRKRPAAADGLDDAGFRPLRHEEIRPAPAERRRHCVEIRRSNRGDTRINSPRPPEKRRKVAFEGVIPVNT